MELGGFEVDDCMASFEGLAEWPSLPFETMPMDMPQELYADFSRKDADDFFSTWQVGRGAKMTLLGGAAARLGPPVHGRSAD